MVQWFKQFKCVFRGKKENKFLTQKKTELLEIFQLRGI